MQTHQMPLFPRHGRHLLAASQMSTGALLLATPALAQAPAQTPKPAADELDADEDGGLSLAEFAPGLA